MTGPRHRRGRPRARPALALSRDPASPRCTPPRATRASPRSPRCTRSTRSTAPRSPPWPRELGADLVVVGPEAPLVAGVADAVRAAGHRLLRPVRRGRPARGLQGLRQGGDGRRRRAHRDGPGVHDRRARSPTALDAFGPPYVVKDDGLAAGKGVVVTDDRDEALAHAAACERVVDRGVPRRPRGVAVRDHRRHDRRTRCCRPRTSSASLDGDAGPEHRRHGRLHAAARGRPTAWSTRCTERVLQPTVDEMARRGTPFAGLLYAGLALTRRGVRVVEFNARFGDPETQPLLALLASPLGAAAARPPPTARLARARAARAGTTAPRSPSWSRPTATRRRPRTGDRDRTASTTPSASDGVDVHPRRHRHRRRRPRWSPPAAGCSP